MKKLLTASLSVAALTTLALAANNLDSNPNYVKLKNFHPKGVTNQQCLICHKTMDPGIVADWEHSKHAKVGVGCVQCHVVPKNYPTAFKTHPLQGKNWTVQIAVSSVTCAKCHAKEVEEFLNSGHARAGAQWIGLNGNANGYLMSQLAYNYESLKGKNPTYGISGAKMVKGIRKDGWLFNANQKHPHIADLNVANLCVQCHGTVVKLNKEGKPLASTWPSDGIASLYPDGGVGNCVACHSRHKFSAAEARQPGACSNCHLGPDHPDKEIFESSVHGHIFETNKQFYNFKANKVVPGKTVRAATCFVCHMSGINGLKPTHNVSLRLKWNLWAPKSFLRTGGHETAGWTYWKGGGKIIVGKTIIRGNVKTGNPNGPEAARYAMKQTCLACHEDTFVTNYFQRMDAAVKVFNEYVTYATQLYKKLASKGLIRHDLWSDPFFKLYYYLWHYEGTRMRHGAAMGSPDYAHWHGVFQVMQDIREMKHIYDYRMKLYKKYGSAKKALAHEVPMPVVSHE
jgi:hypothetical protein